MVLSISHQAQYCPLIRGLWGTGWGREGKVNVRHFTYGFDRPLRISLVSAFSDKKGVGEGGGGGVDQTFEEQKVNIDREFYFAHDKILLTARIYRAQYISWTIQEFYICIDI